jgi:hypothetical protein
MANTNTNTNTNTNKPAPAATVAAPAAATAAPLPQPGKLPAGVQAAQVYRLGQYNARTPVNAAAWQAVQACIAANGGTATAQQLANALALCQNITSNAMLAYLAKPNSKGIAALYAVSK